MAVNTIRSVAAEIGATYWQVRHAIRRGYVGIDRLGPRRKVYLTPTEVRAIKTHFGVVDPEPDAGTQKNVATPRP
jgi:hypothetical protein